MTTFKKFTQIYMQKPSKYLKWNERKLYRRVCFSLHMRLLLTKQFFVDRLIEIQKLNPHDFSKVLQYQQMNYIYAFSFQRTALFVCGMSNCYWDFFNLNRNVSDTSKMILLIIIWQNSHIPTFSLYEHLVL